MFKCHAERSRSIYLKRGLRSFTLVQDDKFAKKMSRGSTAILLLKKSGCSVIHIREQP